MTAVRKLEAGVLLATCLALLSVGLGRVVVHTQTLQVTPLQIGLGAAGAAAAVTVMLAGPVACLAAVGAVTVMTFIPDVSIGGGVNLVAADAFFGALVCWWLARVALPEHRSADDAAGPPLRAWAVGILLGYVGLTLLHVAAVDPGRLSVSFVSWIRLVETAALGWLAAAFIRTRRDVVVVLGAIALAGVIFVAVALVAGAGESGAGPLGSRGGGGVQPDTLGLVCGLLILMGMFGALGRSAAHRVPLTIWGVTGLLQSRSVGAIIGTTVAVALGLAFSVDAPRRVLTSHALRIVTTLAIGLAVAYGVAAIVRPENLPTSHGFGQSSAAQRAVLGTAGLDLAEHHPIIGVGWRRSEEPSVIGDPSLNTRLRARFPSTRNDFFPDVTPGSVHNAYIQVAADLGLIGVGLLVFAFVSLARQILAVLSRATRRSPLWPQLCFLSWGLLLIAIWWNDNPIFGGQPETVLAALFVGAVAGLSRTLPPAVRGSRVATSRAARPGDELLAGVVGSARQQAESAPGGQQWPR